MKCFEILILSNEKNSHYEGRFFMEADSRTKAITEVINFLEIENDNKYKIFSRELSRKDYIIKLQQANTKRNISNQLIENMLNIGVDNIPFNKISSTKMQLDFLDLRDIG